MIEIQIYRQNKDLCSFSTKNTTSQATEKQQLKTHRTTKRHHTKQQLEQTKQIPPQIRTLKT
ncbi:hypothetical protein [Shewanella pneumatophori]|uniref:Uncharacterized protein n=1 Tax=Shewanella pneumatophori TaxID=314092 RepID=A0A9X1ZH15_9GAMM|nr:hypothetical protein [Shewanella pneumatophori]MCL1139785.1 hypothetical protein [Shewanella pneumatophori]